MKHKLSLLLALAIICTALPTPQIAQATDFSFAGLVNSVTYEMPMKYIEKLSSPDFRGRQVGDVGETMAAEFIAEQFASYGLLPKGDNNTYFQWLNVPVFMPKRPISFRQVEGDASIKQFVYKKDFNILSVTGSGKVTGTPVFAGFGITSKTIGYDDYASVDVKGKVAVVIRHAPTFMRAMMDEKPELESLMTFATKMENATAHGAIGFILIENPTLPPNSQYMVSMKFMNGYPGKLPGLFVSVDCADLILQGSGFKTIDLFNQIDQKKAPQSFVIKGPQLSFEVNADYNPSYKARNVVGYIPAADPFGGNETVMITAHYDHLGIDLDGVIYPGACDNASGTAAMMEIARAFMVSGLKPRINICFAALTGEEMGLLGASYMAENPVFPLDGTTVINLDMVSGKPNRVNASIDASFTDLLEKLKFASLKVGANLGQGRAAFNNDSAAFFSIGVPSVFLFGGPGMKWHDPTDTIEFVDKDGVQLVTRLAALTACLYADPFFLTLDDGVGPLEIGSPTYTVSGYTGKGAKVYIGGRQTIASETGRFSIPIDLTLGSNSLKVVAQIAATGEKIEREMSVVYALKPRAVASTDMLNFGYVRKDGPKNAIKFKIWNAGKGELSGVLAPCSKWIRITPDKLSKDTTEVVAEIVTEELPDEGFHICMIQVEYDGGMFFLPVTAVTGKTPEIELKLAPTEKKATIQGIEVPIKQSAEAIGDTPYFPASVLGMAFGAEVLREGDQLRFNLAGLSGKIWSGSNIVLIGNKPSTFKGDVYEAQGELMLPRGLLEMLDVKVTVDENKNFVLKFDASPPQIMFEPKELSFAVDKSWKSASQQIKFWSTKEVTIKLEMPDWLGASASVIEVSKNEKMITLDPLTARLFSQKPQTGTIKIIAPETFGSPGSFEIPTKIDVPQTLKVIDIPVGGNMAKVDGVYLPLASPAFVSSGTTFVPYRFIGEVFGAQVEWLTQTRTVRATLGKTTVELTIGAQKAKINGTETTLAMPATIRDGRTFVPIRFISEAFGAKVEWVAKEKTVNIEYDSSHGLPKLALEKKEVALEWGDASQNTSQPSLAITFKNAGGENIQIEELAPVGPIKAEVIKDKIIVNPTFVKEGFDGVTTLLVKSNGGYDQINFKLGIYPENMILVRALGEYWTINGVEQKEQLKSLDGFISTSALSFISSTAGSSMFDPTTGNLTLVKSGKTLMLSTNSNDFFLNDAKMPWRFKYEAKTDDVVLPWAAYALGFGFGITEDVTGLTIRAPKEKPSQLSVDWPAIDLVAMSEGYTIKPFEAPFYPLEGGKTYSYLNDPAKHKLFFFFNTSQQSAKLIPYIESLGRRYSEKGLSCILIYAGLPTDFTIQSFFSGNRTIMDGLASYSLTGLTLPIIFDPEGKVCEGFPGESAPRLYIVDDEGKLEFKLPEMGPSQVLYTEQAIVSIFDRQGYVPQDVLTLNVSNAGGGAGSGSFSSTSPIISVLSGTFNMSPAQVSVSFDANKIELDPEPTLVKASAILIGLSNQVELPVRCWRVPANTMFASFYNSGLVARVNGVNIALPEKVKAGKEPWGPIDILAKAIGAELTQLPDGSVRMIAGLNDATFVVGQSKAKSGGVEFDMGGFFSKEKGIIYGPMKFLAQFAGAKLSTYDETVVLWAPTIRGKVTTPLLSVNTQSIAINQFIPPPGNLRDAPDFELPSYPYSSKTLTKLSKILARPEVKTVIIDFWATWCPPCKMAMPYLEQLYREYKDKGLVVLGVITDDVGDSDVEETLLSDPRIRSGLKELGIDKITYPMCYDKVDEKTKKNAYTMYDGKAIPRLVVVNKDMKWRYTKIGFWQQGMRNLESKVQRLLGLTQSPEIVITNTGIGELSGNITCSLPYIKPNIATFSAKNNEKLRFTVDVLRAPLAPEKGLITIESNGGASVVPIQYNPFMENTIYKLSIDAENFQVTVNGTTTKITCAVKEAPGDTYLVSADVLFSILGGSLKVLPDRRRAIGIFETWEVSAENGKKEVTAGGYIFKSTLPCKIEGGSVFLELSILAEIIGADYRLENSNKTIIVEYEL